MIYKYEELVERYPVWGFRPFKAAGYVYHKGVWENSMLEERTETGFLLRFDVRAMPGIRQVLLQQVFTFAIATTIALICGQ